MTKVLSWIKEEIIKIIPAVLFFIIAFNLIHLSVGLMLSPKDIRYTSYLGATIGGLVAGKVILLVDSLPFVYVFRSKPAIYNIAWKFLIYGSCAILIQVLEPFLKNLYYFESGSMAFQHMVKQLETAQFWGVQIWVLFLFLIFIIVNEYIRVLGKAQITRILIGPHHL